MKKFYAVSLFFIFYICLNSCVSIKQDNTERTQKTYDKPISLPEKLIADLGKSSEKLLSENRSAIRFNDNVNHILMGTGGVLGTGRFYGHTWDLKNGYVVKASYIQKYDAITYNDILEKAITLFGRGVDLNGNGYAWNISQKGGISFILVFGGTGGDKIILASVEMGYAKLQPSMR
ncbi:MAG: hypothetical protein Ta2B_31020 [Termitinemataceae bacterium]|nr:MAG: hypothetical protein Ta2B_31020 [Termitinemataceae bacterium]